MNTRLIGQALLIVIVAAAAGAPAAVTDRLGRQEYTEVHMGMPVRIVLYAADDAHGRAAARAAFDRIASLEHVMSDYRADSELRRLEARPEEWVRVSAELFAVMTQAVAIARASDGAFDPTIGPLVTVWRQARESKQMPHRSELEQARARVGWRMLAFDASRPAVRLSKPGMRLDLGGIAKGFILQEAVSTLRARGTPRVMVEAGGDIVAGDPPAARTGWRVDVPGVSAGFAARASELANAALSTSGPMAQFVEIDGARYSHVVDPRTGLGVTNGFVAHVIAADAATADAIATALTVLGPESGRGMLVRFPEVVASLRPAETAAISRR